MHSHSAHDTNNRRRASVALLALLRCGMPLDLEEGRKRGSDSRRTYRIQAVLEVRRGISQPSEADAMLTASCSCLPLFLWSMLFLYDTSMSNYMWYLVTCNELSPCTSVHGALANFGQRRVGHWGLHGLDLCQDMAVKFIPARSTCRARNMTHAC
jgi:hypothetical protein